MTPEVAAWRLGCSMALGAALGLTYGFLRPLRPRHTWLADGLFLLAAIWVWLYLSFAICRGDLRTGVSFGMLTGLILWEGTAGRLLRPLFSLFWKEMAVLGGFFARPFKKFANLQKMCLHL